jgi:type II secretory pathway pseudopilin PulG
VDASFASVIAIAGTLLGSALTYLFQIKQSRRAETRDMLQRLRQERLTAYTEFVAAATDYRRSAFTHWYRKQEDSNGRDFLDARAEADRLDALVDRAITQIRLLSSDDSLIAAAQLVRSFAEGIRKAESREERDAQADHCQAALDQFVDHASEQLVPQSVFGPKQHVEA